MKETETMNPRQRSRVARRALLDYRACVKELDALRRKLLLADGGPHAPLDCLGLGVWQIRASIEQCKRAIGLTRQAAECLERLGRVMGPGETVLGVL